MKKQNTNTNETKRQALAEMVQSSCDDYYRIRSIINRKATDSTTATDSDSTTATAYMTLMHECEEVITVNDTSADGDRIFFDFAKAVTQSVMKKVYDASGNQNILRLRNSFMHDISILEKVKFGNEYAYETAYNADGDLIVRVADKNAENALNIASHETLSDSMDLLNTAIESIITYGKDALERFGYADLRSKYTVQRRKRKVWIKEEDSKAVEEVETCAIREIYKDVRRAIMDNKAIDGKGKYFYLEEVTTDPETGEIDKCYRRLPKYADIGGGVAHNTFECGGVNNATIDTPTIGEFDVLAESALVGALDLSERQLQILRLRQRGYGYKAIAAYMGIGRATVQVQVRRIQDKVKTCGAFDADLIAKYTA